MLEQAKRLVAEGKFAFFVALESLDRAPLVDLLSAAEEKIFDFWKADGHGTAWFFLDAVDELKLTEGKLDRALLRLSKAIDGHLDRARVIISCRPNDWRPILDLATVQNRLPMPAARVNPPRPPDEVFLEALRHERGKAVEDSVEDKDELTNSGAVRTVIMLPMVERECRGIAR